MKIGILTEQQIRDYEKQSVINATSEYLDSKNKDTTESNHLDNEAECLYSCLIKMSFAFFAFVILYVSAF
ncbi:hypothetical protein [Pantoea agglomerans]|uniref:hypothetical protein n=1 Tax=Enterobacter agglomerans TaxID=549 RepID=UPI003C7EA906